MTETLTRLTIYTTDGEKREGVYGPLLMKSNLDFLWKNNIFRSFVLTRP